MLSLILGQWTWYQWITGLKAEIEFFIRKWRLDQYAKKGEHKAAGGGYRRDNFHYDRWEDRLGDQRDDRRGNHLNKRKNDNQRVDDQEKNDAQHGHVVNVIHGGTMTSGSWSNARKAYARELLKVKKFSKKTRMEVIISFSNENMDGVKYHMIH